MSDVNTPRRSYAHIIYALVSVACPLIAFALISIYQAYSDEWYWQLAEKPKPLDDADINAGAMMGAVIVIQLILSIGLGSVIGLVFAGLSLKHRTKILSFGTVALLFNATPIASVIWIYIRGL